MMAAAGCLCHVIPCHETVTCHVSLSLCHCGCNSVTACVFSLSLDVASVAVSSKLKLCRRAVVASAGRGQRHGSEHVPWRVPTASTCPSPCPQGGEAHPRPITDPPFTIPLSIILAPYPPPCHAGTTTHVLHCNVYTGKSDGRKKDTRMRRIFHYL